jgi:hypothetical protein
MPLPDMSQFMLENKCLFICRKFLAVVPEEQPEKGTGR